jgi:hypothetical protein
VRSGLWMPKRKQIESTNNSSNKLQIILYCTNLIKYTSFISCSCLYAEQNFAFFVSELVIFFSKSDTCSFLSGLYDKSLSSSSDRSSSGRGSNLASLASENSSTASPSGNSWTTSSSRSFS